MPLSKLPTGPLVLIVDDDADLRDYVRSCLRPLTTQVVEASDGREALEIARALSAEGRLPALVIADVHMPNLDGPGLRTALSALPPLDAVPVLLVTGDALFRLRQPFLMKPFNARQLQEATRNLLSA